MPPRDETISHCLPELADRAFDLRRKAIEAGAGCSIGVDRGEDDKPFGACFTLRAGGKVLGAASLDAEGLSFWIEGYGDSDSATDEEFIEAVRKGLATMETGLEPLGCEFAKVWDESVDTLYES